MAFSVEHYFRLFLRSIVRGQRPESSKKSQVETRAVALAVGRSEDRRFPQWSTGGMVSNCDPLGADCPQIGPGQEGPDRPEILGARSA
ncbi:MAG: hypothetical protein NZ899_09530 [Thermoguttaceae bacterium]|nr:hypothetical protein [Thermoguttaceae bacterium]MDW8079308.1 hypothetical protein [Thermoguttaceae bacterium]